MMRTIVFSFLMLGIISCTPKVKDAGIDYFAEANALKLETEQIQLSLKESVQSLRNQRNNIMVQGRTLTNKELEFVEKVNEILEAQAKLLAFQDDIAKSEEAYEPNGKELFYLNEQANQLVKTIQLKVTKLDQ